MKSTSSRHAVLVRAITASCVLAAALTCQVQRTAHPQETVADGNGSVLPFGCLSPTAFTEARTQILIRSHELPGPGAALVGIEVHCQDAVALDYTLLEIDAYETNLNALSIRFADNVSPFVDHLLSRQNLHVAYDAAGWTSIPLDNILVHDGVSSLVIEVRKTVDPATARFATMSTTSNPVRNDLPSMFCSFGGPNSHASLAATAQTLAAPVSLRLLWIDAPTVRLLSDPGPSGNQFALGGSVIHTVDGSPGAFSVSFLGTLLDSPVFFPPFVGRVLIEGNPVGDAVIGAAGHMQQRFAIPNDGNLVGLHLAFQSATVDAGTGVVMLTNAVDLFVNP